VRLLFGLQNLRLAWRIAVPDQPSGGAMMRQKVRKVFENA